MRFQTTSERVANSVSIEIQIAQGFTPVGYHSDVKTE